MRPEYCQPREPSEGTPSDEAEMFNERVEEIEREAGELQQTHLLGHLSPSDYSPVMRTYLVRTGNIIVVKAAGNLSVRGGEIVKLRIEVGALEGYKVDYINNHNLMLDPSKVFWAFSAREENYQFYGLYLGNQHTVEYEAYADIMTFVKTQVIETNTKKEEPEFQQGEKEKGGAVARELSCSPISSVSCWSEREGSVSTQHSYITLGSSSTHSSMPPLTSSEESLNISDYDLPREDQVYPESVKIIRNEAFSKNKREQGYRERRQIKRKKFATYYLSMESSQSESD